MDQKKLDQQSQHWEKNFSNKPEMFGLEPSLAAIKALNLFKEQNITRIIELGAGLGRDAIFFAQNSIYVEALDYSSSAVEVINLKTKKNNLSNYISTKIFDKFPSLTFPMLSPEHIESSFFSISRTALVTISPKAR